MKNVLILFYLFIFLASCQVNRNVEKTPIDSTTSILLKINLNGIGDEFSEDIIYSVNGNVKSVEISNYSFSKTDSVFIHSLSSFIDNYRNSIYNINRNGQIENRIILSAKNKKETQIEKYEIIDISKNEFKIDFKLYEYIGKEIGQQYLAPKYTNYYKNKILIKKYEDLDKKTILYEYNDLSQISKVIVISEGNIFLNKNIKYKYDSNNRIIEKRHDYENSSHYHQITKYHYIENSYIKINFNYKNNKKTNIDFEYVKIDEFNNIIQRKEYNPLKYNKEILETENETILIDDLVSEIENSNKNWITYSEKCKYEFDKNNNWITKTILTNENTPKDRIKRKIVYY